MEALTYLINESLSNCVFPSAPKLTRVIPIFKSTKHKVGDYRLIALFITFI